MSDFRTNGPLFLFFYFFFFFVFFFFVLFFVVFFFAFVQFSTSECRMSEGTFCRVADQNVIGFIPRHLEKCGVLYYTLRKKMHSSVRPCVRLSIHPSISASFPGSNFYEPIFFKLGIGFYIRKEWFCIEDGHISSNKYRVMALDLL